MNEPVIVSSTERENYDTITIRFDWPVRCRPGQFVMVWIPGVDEIPMSLSHTDGRKGITVKAIGDATRSLHSIKAGDTLHVRGPYGNGFSLDRVDPERTLIVAGGVGMAAVMPVVRATGADVVFGGRTSEDIIFVGEASRRSQVHISTDDGSAGFHGNAVQLAGKLMKVKGYDTVIGCGPEVMLYHLHRLCVENNVKIQMSLERYMKCGAGVCGSCMMDHHRVCRDGPVFTGEAISEMRDFGRSKRDPSGLIVPL